MADFIITRGKRTIANFSHWFRQNSAESSCYTSLYEQSSRARGPMLLIVTNLRLFRPISSSCVPKSSFKAPLSQTEMSQCSNYIFSKESVWWTEVSWELRLFHNYTKTLLDVLYWEDSTLSNGFTLLAKEMNKMYTMTKERKAKAYLHWQNKQYCLIFKDSTLINCALFMFCSWQLYLTENGNLIYNIIEF